MKRRIKFYGGGRYSYGKVRKGDEFKSDVMPVSKFPVLTDFIDFMKARGVIDSKFKLSQAVFIFFLGTRNCP